MEEKQTGTIPPVNTKNNAPQKDENSPAYWTRTVVYLLVSTLLISFAAYALIAPNEFTIGGIAGIAVLVNVASHGRVPQSLLVFLLNFPLVVASYFCVKRKFAILATASIVLQSVWLLVIENCFPSLIICFNQPAERLFAAICSGLCLGVALALSFRIGGCTGGADILAVMIQKKMKSSSLAWIIFSINVIVIGASFFVYYKPENELAYNVLPVMLSIVPPFVASKVQESFSQGFNAAVEFRIVTDKPYEMAEALMRELSRGVTLIPATGMYTGNPHSLLSCVVNRRQVPELKRVIQTVDPDSFATMTSVSQVLGMGFYTEEYQ